MIEAEIQQIDIRLDEEIQEIQFLLQSRKKLEYSLINNDLVYLYNEMLTLSYSLKLWILDDFLVVVDDPEELLDIIKNQFADLRCLAGRSEKEKCTKTISNRCIQPYQRLNQAV